MVKDINVHVQFKYRIIRGMSLIIDAAVILFRSFGLVMNPSSSGHSSEAISIVMVRPTSLSRMSDHLIIVLEFALGDRNSRRPKFVLGWAYVRFEEIIWKHGNRYQLKTL